MILRPLTKNTEYTEYLNFEFPLCPPCSPCLRVRSFQFYPQNARIKTCAESIRKNMVSGYTVE